MKNGLPHLVGAVFLLSCFGASAVVAQTSRRTDTRAVNLQDGRDHEPPPERRAPRGGDYGYLPNGQYPERRHNRPDVNIIDTERSYYGYRRR